MVKNRKYDSFLSAGVSRIGKCMDKSMILLLYMQKVYHMKINNL